MTRLIPKQAVSIANKFVNQKVTAVVGHWNSNCFDQRIVLL